VVDYKPKPGLSQAGRGVAYRVMLEDYDDETEDFVKLLQELGEDANADKLKGLVLGSWGGEATCVGEGGQEVIDALLSLKDKLPELEAVFLGDILQEECEVSWIRHGDWGPLVGAFPKLEHFRVRGNAAASAFSSDTLRSLVIQSMTSAETAQSVAAANLPELEHLELWLGTDDYGGDSSVDDIMPILSGKLLPKLRYLGLRNAEQADEVAEAVASSPILDQIEVLDLSLGVLTDRGGNALLASPGVKKLKRLNLQYNYLSDELKKKLRALGPEVDTSIGDYYQDDDPEYRFVAVGE